MSESHENFKISSDEIDSRVKDLSKEIYEFYKSNDIRSLHFIFLLTSSFIFAADLLRKLSIFDLKIKTDVIFVKSYAGTRSTEIQTNVDDLERINLNNKAVLIVDDILDTGKTLSHVRKEILKRYTPKIFEFCCLLKKPENSRNMDFGVKFIGFEIPKTFVVGYGLDYNGFYRELPFVRNLDQSKVSF